MFLKINDKRAAEALEKVLREFLDRRFASPQSDERKTYQDLLRSIHWQLEKELCR